MIRLHIFLNFPIMRQIKADSVVARGLNMRVIWVNAPKWRYNCRKSQKRVYLSIAWPLVCRTEAPGNILEKSWIMISGSRKRDWLLLQRPVYVHQQLWDNNWLSDQIISDLNEDYSTKMCLGPEQTLGCLHTIWSVAERLSIISFD